MNLQFVRKAMGLMKSDFAAAPVPEEISDPKSTPEIEKSLAQIRALARNTKNMTYCLVKISDLVVETLPELPETLLEKNSGGARYERDTALNDAKAALKALKGALEELEALHDHLYVYERDYADDEDTVAKE